MIIHNYIKKKWLNFKKKYISCKFSVYNGNTIYFLDIIYFLEFLVK